MAKIDSGSKSSRLLASRRYTHDTYTTAQESFTEVLDLGASEIYTQAEKIPSSGLPFSGSSQSGSYYQVNDENILKYYYRHKLTKSNLNNETWFVLSPTGSDSGIGAQLINDSQQTNFISPKYSISSLANSTTEDSTPGYLAVLYQSSAISASAQTSSLAGSDKVSTNNYIFDYKTGIVQFMNSALDPSDTEHLYMTVYQYVGKTLATGLELDGSVSGSSTSTGSFGLILGDGSQLTNLPASFTAADISGSWRGELSSSAMTDVGGGVTGSSTSTGSFGNIVGSGNVRGSRFEIDGTSDYIDTALGSMFIVTTGDISAQLGNGKALKVTGGIEATTSITASKNIVSTGANAKISGSATSTGSFGDILVGATENSQLYSDFSQSIQSRVASAVAGGVTSVTGGTGLSSTGGTTPTVAVDFSDSNLQKYISGSYLGELSSSVYLQNVKGTISGSLGVNAALIRTLTASTISGSYLGELSSSVYLQNVKGTISGSLGDNAALIRTLTAPTISGSWRGELSSSTMAIVGGGVSGSVSSTGSFGKLYTNQRISIGKKDPSPSEIHILSATPAISLQRTSNSNDSVIDFQGSNGASGAKIVFTDDGDGANHIAFHTFDGSTTQERLKITGNGADGVSISGSSVSTGSFGTLRAVDPAGINITAIGSVSGSSVSTGSFGRMVASGPTVTVAGGSLILGEEAYSLGSTFVGLKTSHQTGTNDYMIISGKSDGTTFISAKDGEEVEIRGGGNRETNRIVVPDDTFIKLGGTDTTLLRPESDNKTNLGSSTLRYKDLHLSGDISSSGHISSSLSSTGSFGRVDGTTFYGTDLYGTIKTAAQTNITSVGTIGTGVWNGTAIDTAYIDATLTSQTSMLNDSLKIGRADGNDSIDFGSDDTILFDIDNTERMRVDAAGIDVTGNITATGNATITGDLTVNGTTTTISTTNLAVGDSFIFTATGSASTNVDGGIIVQSGSAVDSGSALYHDTNSERWAVAKSIASNATAVTPKQMVTTTTLSTSAPSNTDGDYGVGEMWIDTDDEEIWIRTN